MKIVYNSLKKKPAECLKQEDKGLRESYGKKVDFVDFDSLKPILEAVR